MSTTPGSTNSAREGHMSHINSTSCIDSNVAPPLPKKKQVCRILSKKKTAKLMRVTDENVVRSCNTAATDHVKTEDMKKQPENGIFQMTNMKVFCTESPDSGYLTPADPPTYDFNTGGTIPIFCHRTDKSVLRLDSGIGSEPSRGPGHANYSGSAPVSPTSLLTVSRLSAQYEDIDHYSRIHEDQHQSSHRHQVPSSISGHLHDPPHTYLQFNTKHTPTSQKSTRQCRDSCWIVISLIAILLVSTTALSTSIYQLVTSSSKPRQISQDLKQTLSKMELTVDNLIKENEALKGTLIMQEINLTSVAENKIIPVVSQLQNLSLMIESVNDKFDAQIANISLVPGPQGKPGLVNFSLCLNQSITKSAPASATAPTETSLLPSLTDIQKYFVTFAYCTYSGATDVNLERQGDNTTQRQRYRCKCWGQVTGINQTLCTVVIWMCPQE